MSDNAASAVGGVPVSGSRAGFYARVSSEQQAKENTIASQLEALKQRMRQDGTTLEEELCFIDEGYSGSTLLRPSLERLRDVAAAGGLDRLYVHSPDRLARKYAYQVLLIDELRRCGVEAILLNRTIGTAPEDDLLLQVQGMVAEYERAVGREPRPQPSNEARRALPPTGIVGVSLLRACVLWPTAEPFLPQRQVPTLCLLSLHRHGRLPLRRAADL